MATVPRKSLHCVQKWHCFDNIVLIMYVCNTAIRFSARVIDRKLDFAIRILALQIASKTWILLWRSYNSWCFVMLLKAPWCVLSFHSRCSLDVSSASSFSFPSSSSSLPWWWVSMNLSVSYLLKTSLYRLQRHWFAASAIQSSTWQIGVRRRGLPCWLRQNVCVI